MSSQLRKRQDGQQATGRALLVKTLMTGVFKPARRLSEEEFKRVLEAGIEYSSGLFAIPFHDPGLDIDKAIAFLKEYVEGFTSDDVRKIMEEWKNAEPGRELKRVVSEIAGVRVKEVDVSPFKHLQGELFKRGEIRFRPVRLSSDEFETLRERFRYLGDGWFAINVCGSEELRRALAKVLGNGNPVYTKTSLDNIAEYCSLAEAEAEKIEKIKKTIREKHGVEPTHIEEKGDYYVVKFPLLGTEKFKELAKTYKYKQGKFYIEKSKL
jgi:hypothetical protein